MRWPVVALLVAAAGLARAASTLDGVHVVRVPAIAVRLELSVPVEPVVHTLPAADGLPPRIYLDLPGTVLGDVAAQIASDATGLQRVRTGQFDPTTARVVLDLDVPRAYAVRREATRITVEIAGATPLAIEPPSEPHPGPALGRSPLPPVARPLPAPAAAHRPLVIVDAGHGGRDPGATGIDGVLEKTLTLDLAGRIANRLPDRLPVEARLTRRDDDFLPIDERIALASSAVLFISVHANASLDPRMRGIEVFFGGGGPTAASSGGAGGRPLSLGLAVVEAFEQRLGDVRTLVRPGGYGVLARNAVPSVLVEVGYLTNAEDAARLRDAAYRDLLADAVVDAVDAFLHDRVAS